MVQEQQLQRKMKFFFGYNMKVVIQWGHKNLVGSIFPVGGESTNFRLVGLRGTSYRLPEGKTLHVPIQFYSIRSVNLQTSAERGRLSKACADNGTLVKYIFGIKTSECSKLFTVYFQFTAKLRNMWKWFLRLIVAS